MQPALHSFAYCLDYLREQVADVADADIAAQPANNMNHAAWVIGHLVHACQLLGGVIGLNPWLSPDWPERYGTGSKPTADRSAYESKTELLEILRDAQERMTKAVEDLEDTSLEEPFPDPSYLDVFPTVRHALTQVLVGHTANHVGQLSLWRKALGLGPMSRSFE